MGKPYRNRVDVVALDDKGRVYSGLYPDGSVGLFGGGVDGGETVLRAAQREFKEESGRKLKSVQRLSISPFTESEVVRKGWAKSGKTDRLEKYRGSRTYFAIGKVVDGKATKKSEPSDHIKDIKFRPLEDVIALQERAIAKAKPGHKGLGEKRLKALREALKTRMGSKIEQLAKLEHEQWTAWAKEVSKTEKIKPKRKARWKKHFVPYAKLPAKGKNQDRKWAQKVIDIMEKKSLDDSHNPSNTLTMTRPAERSSLFTQTRTTTQSSLPETKPISDGTEPGAFDGVTKTSTAQKIAERLLELYAERKTSAGR